MSFARPLTFLFFVCVCSASAITLQEKIKRAEIAADAAVEGSPNQTAVPSAAPGAKDAPAAPQESAAKNGAAAAKEKQKTKYVVNTDDFINGLYIGKIGLSQKELEQLHESARLAEKLIKSGKKYSFGESAVFFVAGEDAAAVSAVKSAALACEAAFERLFSSAYAAAIASKIAVRIFKDGANMKDAEIKIGEGGIFVDIKWHKALAEEDVCRALAGSVFAAISRAEGRSGASAPHWLESALTLFVLDELKLGVPTSAARWGLEVPYKSIPAILEYPRGGATAAAQRAHAYWLLLALEKLSGKSNLLVFLRNIAGGNLSAAETFAEIKKLASAAGAEDAELIIGCAIYAEMSARAGGVASPAASDAELLRLCSVRAFENSLPISIPCDKLFLRRDAALAPARARLAELKLLLIKTNPIYFNAAAALGGVYEAFIAGDKTAYAERLNTFFTEFARARAIAKDVSATMGDLLPKREDGASVGGILK